VSSVAAVVRQLVSALVVLALPRVAVAQGSSQRMALEAETKCRVEPDTTAQVVRSYQLGRIIDVERGTLRGGTLWLSTETVYVSGLHPLCWINGALTVPHDPNHPDSALVALTGRVLRQDVGMRFDDFITVENLLLGRYAATLQESGLLQYRRLLIVEKANAMRDVLAEKPLEVAWALAHRDVLARDPFAAGLYQLAKPYWDLYDRFQTATWADELAWHAAQLRRPTDECYSDCVLTAGIIEGPMQYWRRLPRGKAIVPAIELAIKTAQYAADLACYDRKERPVSQSESPVPAPLLSEIRSSLALVTVDAKRQLLDRLAEAEAKCR
jgi:hypothetical protein